MFAVVVVAVVVVVAIAVGVAVFVVAVVVGCSNNALIYGRETRTTATACDIMSMNGIAEKIHRSFSFVSLLVCCY